MAEARIRNIPEEVWTKLRIIALKQGKTVNELVVEILTETIRKEGEKSEARNK